MTDPLLLHAQARRAHQQAITALKGITQYLEGTTDRQVAEDALHVVHQAFAKAETALADTLGSETQRQARQRQKLQRQADELDTITQIERLLRMGQHGELVAKVLDFRSTRHLYSWLKTHGRHDIITALKTRKKA